ncbi:copper amine oxidase N-terminal domain-containing protein [Paenibacillus pinisoli]|uniref:Copper amine oxidase N-terminal domain-containing protein n=1 Tax=Paenibacillus pinisoli TaxID=1276110 RepID=A0A3A6PY10_9BACL|nr:stalk domain-containing protein [Paenibacillus pinisoli]RJX38724.1 copper amine oxidase N-terminal domain-containing protein [Paenibacillus pinisoli]
MKKKIMLLSLALMLVAIGAVSAAAKWGTFEGYNIVKLVINGKEVIPKDTPPVILKGRTMVPLSMLEQAGVKSTWDGSTYTVNVESNAPVKSDNEQQIINYVEAMDFYKTLDDLGVRLMDLAESLMDAYDGIIYYDETDTLDKCYDYYNTAAKNYNSLLKEYEAYKKLFTSIGMDTNGVTKAFTLYKGALDDYSNALDYLEDIVLKPDSEALTDQFLDVFVSGHDKSTDGSIIGMQGYYKYRGLILD